MVVKNTKVAADTWAGMLIEPSATYTIQSTELSTWQANDKVITDISSGDLLIGADGSTWETAGATGVAFLMGSKHDVKVTNSPPFASKKIEVGGVEKSLFKRVHGVYADIGAGATVNIDFVVPYPVVKFTGANIFGGSLGDSLNFKVLDDASNTYSGAPGSNYQLNQFGFDVAMPDGPYENTSNYDADLYYGMVIRCEYTNNTASTKKVGLNCWLHEVK